VRIVTIGRGNIGGGLAERWRNAGHEVTVLGSDGGDASGADAVLLAVPAGAAGDALAKVGGVEGVPVIDATNVVRVPRPDGFDSIAEYVKSVTGGPVAKAFSANFARKFGDLDGAAETPSMVFAADDGAREVTETLIRDAGYDPVYAGDLSNARAVEDFLAVLFAIAGQRGPFFYRIY
jgi:8-hydroxy-5-deazaflavin:NADPH oxidoreductase